MDSNSYILSVHPGLYYDIYNTPKIIGEIEIYDAFHDGNIWYYQIQYNDGTLYQIAKMHVELGFYKIISEEELIIEKLVHA